MFSNLLQSGSSEIDREAEDSHPGQADSDRNSDAGHTSPRPLRIKRKRKKFISPALILKVFPNIPPGPLCELSELEFPTPSEVLTLTGATSEQIGQFFELLSNPLPKVHARSRKPRSRPPADEHMSLVDELKDDLKVAEDARHVLKKESYSLRRNAVGTTVCN